MAIVPNDPLIMAIIAEAKEKFTAAMNDDLNTPQAIAGLFELIDKVNQVQEKEGLNKHDAKQILKFVKKIDQVWNFILSEFKPSREFSNRVQNLIDQRNEWRQKKNYAEADKIRAELAAMNVIIKDQGEETIWTI